MSGIEALERLQRLQALDLIDEAVIRTARKHWTCAGDGSNRPNYAEECTGTISAGEHHVEYRGEAPPYKSGSRHCLACAEAFYVKGEHS